MAYKAVGFSHIKFGNVCKRGGLYTSILAFVYICVCYAFAVLF